MFVASCSLRWAQRSGRKHFWITSVILLPMYFSKCSGPGFASACACRENSRFSSRDHCLKRFHHFPDCAGGSWILRQRTSIWLACWFGFCTDFNNCLENPAFCLFWFSTSLCNIAGATYQMEETLSHRRLFASLAERHHCVIWNIRIDKRNIHSFLSQSDVKRCSACRQLFPLNHCCFSVCHAKNGNPFPEMFTIFKMPSGIINSAIIPIAKAALITSPVFSSWNFSHQWQAILTYFYSENWTEKALSILTTDFTMLTFQ